jgi:gliding motility-associated-like protein
LWSNGSTSNNINDVAGTYSVTVTDDNGCSKTASVTITQPANPLAVSGTANNVSCNGASNGSIFINATGGTLPYNYLWSNGSTVPNLVSLNANTYTVTVTDGNGCTATETFNVSEPSAIQLSIVGTDVSCAGAADGSADLSVNGGTTPYTFAWSNFASSEDLTGIGGGKYFVVVTDANGCSARDSVTIIEPTPIVVVITISNVLCNGGTGSISASVSGGSGSYNYAWSNGATSSSITDVAGTYSLTVTDNTGCSKVVSATITQPASAVSIIGNANDVTCNGLSNGSININVIGGTVPYSYAWSNGAVVNSLNGLSANTYTVTVTDGNGCTATASYIINEPSALVTSISGTDVTCAGANDGTVDLNVTGGTTPYTYSWNTFANTQDLNGVAGGTYIVVVTDANGCTARETISIVEPQPLVINLVALNNVNCNGGNNASIDVNITGGTTPYIFAWSNGANTEDVSGLQAGSYTLTVTDFNGCSAVRTFNITQPSAIQVSGVVKNVSCAGAADGTVAQSIVGGVQPYTFAWSNGATTQDLSGLSGNSYSFTVTDFNGCTATAVYNVAEPQPLASTITKTDVDCPGASNGAASISVSGGTAPYTYFWSNFTINQNINAVSGGKYYVIVKDKNNCELRDSVVIVEPQPIVITPTVTNVSCNNANDGSITVAVTGGTPNYSFAWSNGGTGATITGLAAGQYALTVTDANFCTKTISVIVTQPVVLSLTGVAVDALCNGGSNGKVDITVVGGTVPYTFSWSNGSTLEDLNNITAGTYDVTVTDFAGCTATGSYVVGEPTPIVSSVTSTDVTCFNAKNGTATVQVSGGTAPYSYLWSTFQGSASIGNLNGGLYIVIITDNNGCEKRDSANIFEPQPLVLSTTVNQISCFNANDGAITVNVTGGTPNYTFAWSNGAVGATLTGLAGGIYEVTVTDFQGCTAVTSAQIINPSQLNINALVKTPKCSGDSNGSIDLIVSGGTPVYRFNWSNGDTIEDLNNIASGVYIVTVTDSKGCTATDTVDVSQPSPLYQTGIVTDVSCAGASDGVIINTAYGGTLPYTYEWNDGSVNKDRGNLAGGTYRVTVTDGNGCTAQGVYSVVEPLPLVVSLVKNDVTCFGAATGSVAAVVSGGTYPYYYLWSNFEIDSAQFNLNAGKFAVVVTDKNNCRITDSITINQNAPIEISGIVADSKCNGVADGQISITVSGGTGNYSFAWTGGVTSQNLSNVNAGVYTVTVTDGSLCSATATFTVGEKTKLSTTMSVSNPICSGGNTGFASVVVTGGAEPYTYSWSSVPQQTGATATQLAAGIYVVSITDSYGCVATDSAILIQPVAITVATTTVGSKCSNTATGKVTATVTGGNAPYVYILNNITQSSNEFNGLLPGTYTLLVRDVNGCEGIATFTINAPNSISVNLVSDKQIILAGMEAQLSAITNSTKNVVSHVWSPLGTFNFSDCADSNNCSNPRVAPLSTTTYTVVVMDEDSCTATDTFTVAVANVESSFLPTAFTPNGDGLNDRFEFDILGALDAHVKIFDRWGNLIYENEKQLNGIDLGEGWDGTFKGAPVQFDTYVYMMKVRYYNGVEKDITGTISVMK